MYNIWNQIGISEIEEHHLACQTCSIFKNKRLTEIEIQQPWKEISKDEIVPERVDTVSEMTCGGSSGTETVREQCCDLETFSGGRPEDHIKNLIYQRLIEIKHEGRKEIFQPYVVETWISWPSEVKCIPVRNLSEPKYVTTASALLVCEKVGVKTDHAINKKEPFWKRRIENDIAISRKNFSRTDDWFKGRWKNAVTNWNVNWKRNVK